MSILDITTQTNLQAAAIVYFLEGLSVIPLMGKKASVMWTHYQKHRAQLADIHRWDRENKLHNIGIVCGQVSENLIVMDLDGQSAIQAFEKTFPYLLDTFTVNTGSGYGKHLYYRVDHLPPTTRLLNGNHNNIELRSNGLYVVAPPSIHPSTQNPYEIGVRKPIRQLADLKDVFEWMTQLNREKKRQTLAAKPAPAKASAVRTIGFWPANVTNPTAWTNAAINNEIRAVRSSREGTRNDRLNTAAYNLGQIVGLGWLTWNAAEQALLEAARGCRLPDGEALRTIQSGLQKGISEPRDTQWQKRRA